MVLTNLPKIIYGTAWKKDQTKALVIQAVLQVCGCIIVLPTRLRGNPRDFEESILPANLNIIVRTWWAKHWQNYGSKIEFPGTISLSRQSKYTPIRGHDRSQPIPYDPSTPISTQIRTSFEKSLSNLRTTWLDSYLLHSPLENSVRNEEAWRTLCDLKSEGMVRRIGVSNAYDVQTLELLQSIGKVDVVQNRWYEGNAWDVPVHKYCLERGIIYESFWTLTGSPLLYQHPLITNIAKSKNATNAQVVYKFAQSLSIIPLAGSTNERHMKDGLESEILDIDEHLDELKGLIGH
ncbi:unnamed protein product [Rhizoctonia solani]|uniref:NADP-dependent oxidoreductase domain-containing protein n=1 Tax=Rhizoctonia solani TaxID=456999 RepID=A0A8H3BV64_9AGAM|nr:unnamed protein product [Rhizoctonia solani]